MKLTTKGRFAVTAMLDVAMHGGTRPVTLADVAMRQHISLSYLEQLFGKLRRRALVESVRGPRGGYQLARASDRVTVAEIIFAVEEPLDSTQCGGKENCRHEQRCMTHDLWVDLNRAVYAFLAGVTLRQLMDQQQAAAQEPKPVALVANARRHGAHAGAPLSEPTHIRVA
jgi:Rrf2 family iron-sulfur cluster assembly transcriptional regulator